MRTRIVRRILLPAMAMVLAAAAPARMSAQSADGSSGAVDLNEYYKFPVAVGFEYQSLTPFSALNVPYSIFDLAGVVTVPIPGIPVLQPYARAGYVRFNSLDTQFPGKWDQYQLYGVAGAAYARKISKNFEVGGDLNAGFAEAIFPNVMSSGPVSSPYLLFGAGARLSLTPSYGFSIDFHPGLRYQMSLSPFSMLDGVLLSLGVSASYRFGDDPDSARAIIRSLRIGEAEIPPAFTAMQSYYASNPIGRVQITNTEKQAITDVVVSFNQKEYMDSPTPCLTLPRIEAGKTVEVPLKAVFNSKVYDLEGGMGYTPLTGEIVATYKLGGRSAEQRSSVTYNLYDKRAMTWDDDRKAAAFITPLDRALKNYTAFINEASKEKSLPTWNQALQIAMQAYDALREIGIYYQDDPAAPFARVQGNKTLVDFISMPRDTLVRKYGDCKNLTVLYCSLLETKSVRTGFITVPGHIYPVVDTGQPAGEYRDIHPDRSMTLAIDGTLWVPVEVTMLDGKSDFMAAWQRAIDEWKTYEKDRAFYRTRDAQAVYSPVAIQQLDLGLQYGSGDHIAQMFGADLDSVGRTVVAPYAADAQRSGDKKDYNRLGITAAKFRFLKDAEDAFTRALKADPGYVSALVNLGNLSYVKGDYRRAIASYMSVIPLMGKPAKGSAAAKISVVALVNAARAYEALKQTNESQGLMAQASGIDADQMRDLAIAPPGAGGGASTRASNAGAPEVMYLGE
jgi:tetratricopeptide (TPR) repeat protein